jgi:L-fucose isomerase-like protein
MDDLPTSCTLQPSHPLSDLFVYPRTLPSFRFASKQLHAEGIREWLRRTRLIPNDRPTLLKQVFRLLTAVNGFKDVRLLSFGGVHPMACSMA